MHIIGEHYHIYNRGAHKAPIFHDVSDYERFTSLLYIANDSTPLQRPRKSDVFDSKRKATLVEIFAYCLMPNHYHLGLKEVREQGIEKFMKKLCTAYAMYYNKKYNHSGTIFQGSYKFKHVDTERYLSILLEYIHLNPFGIEESELMKEARPQYYEKALFYSKNYEFSSFRDYLGEIRPKGALLSRSDLDIVTYSLASPPLPYIQLS